MKEELITALTREYAEELCPDNKLNREMIELDCLGFLDRVLNSYCLVEKSEVERIYNLNKKRLQATHGLTSASVVELLESLFPEIAKEVEE